MARGDVEGESARPGALGWALSCVGRLLGQVHASGAGNLLDVYEGLERGRLAPRSLLDEAALVGLFSVSPAVEDGKAQPVDGLAGLLVGGVGGVDQEILAEKVTRGHGLVRGVLKRAVTSAGLAAEPLDVRLAWRIHRTHARVAIY